MRDALEKNLRLIRVHELAMHTTPWIVVIALFINRSFGISGVIQLGSVSYLAVVAFEVPSGWASDRYGRVITLRLVGVAWVAAMACYLLGEDRFVVVAMGQALMGAGYAGISGTDVTFHYDTLEALGREAEYADRQAKVSSRGRFVGALGLIGGGLLGAIDLRLPFVASLIFVAIQFTVTLGFTEPPKRDQAEPLGRQLAVCASYLRSIPMVWIFGYGIAMVVLEHVAHTLLPPWMTLVLGETADDVRATPIVVGLTMAAIAIIGAFAARSSATVARSLGVRSTLVGLGALSAVIVTAMALWQHLAVIALVIFRSAQGAAGPILISAAVAPVVAQQHRATFLSLNSLVGRAFYGGLLLILSTNVDDNTPRALAQFSIVSWVLVALTVATAVRVRRRHGPVTI